MKQEFARFLAALGFFTRVPVAGGAGLAPLERSMRYLPLVGLIVGAIGAGVTELAALVLPVGIAVLLGMAATLLVTGGFHEDGFADSCDGFGGGWDKAQVLAIMKDSRIGNFAALGIGMMLLTKWSALTEIDAAFGPPFLALALIAAHGASRLAATALMYALEYARDDASSKSKPLTGRMAPHELAIAATTGLAPCLLLPFGDVLLALAATTLVAFAAGRYFLRRIGGYTGDCLGATQQLCELAFYLGLLCSFT